MTKYELFKKITDELTPLIIKLEKEILGVLSNYSKSTPIKTNTTQSSFGKKFQSLARSIFAKESNENVLFLYKNRKKNLKNYIELENKLNKICDEIISENFDNNLILENLSEIPKLLSNFRQSFINVVKNLADELQSDYDLDKAEMMRKLGSESPPDEVSDAEIELSHQRKRQSQPIDSTLQDFNKLPDYDEDETKLTKFTALLRIYFLQEEDYETLPILLKKIIDENKYEEAKSLLSKDIREKLEELIKEYEQHLKS